LNCTDITYTDFRVTGPDSHGFDRDNDGTGCESSENDQPPTICTMEISYGQDPCDEYYIPPDENGQYPEGHLFIDERTGCVPENEFGPPPPDCNVSNQLPECAPTECPDGRIMSPGEPCPDDALPCDDPDAPEGRNVPTECPAVV
jgi:hypothetical protein